MQITVSRQQLTMLCRLVANYRGFLSQEASEAKAKGDLITAMQKQDSERTYTELYNKLHEQRNRYDEKHMK